MDGIITGICSILALGEVKAAARFNLEQLVISLANDQHLAAFWHDAADQFPDPKEYLLIVDIFSAGNLRHLRDKTAGRHFQLRERG